MSRSQGQNDHQQGARNQHRGAGGVLLETLGVGVFPWALVILLLPTLLVTWRAKNHGFPPTARRDG